MGQHLVIALLLLNTRQVESEKVHIDIMDMRNISPRIVTALENSLERSSCTDVTHGESLSVLYYLFFCTRELVLGGWGDPADFTFIHKYLRFSSFHNTLCKVLAWKHFDQVISAEI